MNKQTELKNRFYEFALAIVKLVRKLPRETAALEIGKQLIRSGTSVAANYEEATCGFSKSDFIYKLSISFKEAKETKIWLSLLKDSEIVKEGKEIGTLICEAHELASILAKSLKTSRSNLKQESQSDDLS